MSGFLRVLLEAGALHPDMSCRQLAVLVAVAGRPGGSCRSLARGLGLSEAAVSRATDLLRDLHLISKKPSTADRRLVVLTINDAGRTLLRGQPHRPAIPLRGAA